METPSSEREPAPLIIGTTMAEGRYNAMMFASRCEGDVSEIQRKIAETTRYINSGAPMMRPGLTPRIYQDGFLAGLEEALTIVDEMKRRGEEEDLDLAFGRRRAEVEGWLDAWMFASKHWKDPEAIEAKIQAGQLAVPIPDSIARPAAPIFSNYYTMGMMDALKAALQVVKSLSRD